MDSYAYDYNSDFPSEGSNYGSAGYPSSSSYYASSSTQYASGGYMGSSLYPAGGGTFSDPFSSSYSSGGSGESPSIQCNVAGECLDSQILDMSTQEDARACLNRCQVRHKVE